MSRIDSGTGLHPMVPRESSRGRTKAPRGNGQSPVAERKDEVEKEEEREVLDVPSEAELFALRHRYAFFAFKFVLGVRMRALTNFRSCIIRTIIISTRS